MSLAVKRGDDVIRKSKNTFTVFDEEVQECGGCGFGSLQHPLTDFFRCKAEDDLWEGAEHDVPVGALHEKITVADVASLITS